MSFKVTLQEVVVDSVKKGARPYQVANVAYTYQGNARKQRIVSFANPQVFAEIQKFKPGDDIEVTTTKNGEYTEWSKVEPVGASSAPPARGSTKVIGSNYETPDERAQRQLMIVRQSSISNAIEFASHACESPITLEYVLEHAQKFVDFVYGNEIKLPFADMPDDIPAE